MKISNGTVVLITFGILLILLTGCRKSKNKEPSKPVYRAEFRVEGMNDISIKVSSMDVNSDTMANKSLPYVFNANYYYTYFVNLAVIGIRDSNLVVKCMIFKDGQEINNDRLPLYNGSEYHTFCVKELLE